MHDLLMSQVEISTTNSVNKRSNEDVILLSTDCCEPFQQLFAGVCETEG